jgi:hypothetical protein
MTYGPALRAGTGPLEMGEEDAQAAATREETSSRTKDEGLSSIMENDNSGSAALCPASTTIRIA